MIAATSRRRNGSAVNRSSSRRIAVSLASFIQVLDKPMAQVYADLQATEADPTLSVTVTATKYLEELRAIFVAGVAQGTFA